MHQPCSNANSATLSERLFQHLRGLLLHVGHLLCAEHAVRELQTEPGYAHEEGREEFGAEEYARNCERAVDALGALMRLNGDDEASDDIPILGLIVE